MSSLRVDVTVISEVVHHPNADRLDVVRIGVTDWYCITGRDQFRPGDKCIYLPIDSVLAPKLENYLFPPDSKITLEKHRIRSIKIRQVVSQGMVIEVTPELRTLFDKLNDHYKIGNDVAEILEVTKYEPPHQVPQGMQGRAMVRKGNPDFTKFTDIANFKYYPTLFADDEPLYITEKLHGTSVRYANLPIHANTLWKKARKFWGYVRNRPVFEFCYGSRNVQLQDGGKQYYQGNIYSKVAKELELRGALRPGEALYGEIIGSGIQKGFAYGHGEGEHTFFAYDVKVDGKYLDAWAFREWCASHVIKTVPLLVMDAPRKEVDLDGMTHGPSVVIGTGNQPVQPVREGIVIKPMIEEQGYMGRKVLKHINTDYLLKEQTEYH